VEVSKLRDEVVREIGGCKGHGEGQDGGVGGEQRKGVGEPGDERAKRGAGTWGSGVGEVMRAGVAEVGIPVMRREVEKGMEDEVGGGGWGDARLRVTLRFKCFPSP